MVSGDLKGMEPRWVIGVSLVGYGCSLALGLGIPIPILDEDMARYTGVSDGELFAQIIEYGSDYPKGEAASLGHVSYEELMSGSIKFNGQEIPSVPLSSRRRAIEIAQVLKSWIEKGDFFLGEAQEPLPV
jgi:uncharacterized protein (DUF39 family)